jgi:hypothetical protein
MHLVVAATWSGDQMPFRVGKSLVPLTLKKAAGKDS